MPPATAKAHYDCHNNDPGDLRYRAFLSRLANPLIDRLTIGAHGLDYGSGPGPTLSLMLEEAGFTTDIFDPLYSPNQACLNRSYDFITASEVAEHFDQPRTEFQRLWAILRPGGLLGIMTKRLSTPAAFINWHYKNDPTHISFYAADTFLWISKWLSASLEFVDRDVVLLGKPIAEATAADGLTD